MNSDQEFSQLRSKLSDSINRQYRLTIGTILLVAVIVFGAYWWINGEGLLNSRPALNEIIRSLIFGLVTTVIASIMYSFFLKRISDEQFDFIIQMAQIDARRSEESLKTKLDDHFEKESGQIESAVKTINDHLNELDYKHVDVITVEKRFLGIYETLPRLSRDTIQTLIRKSERRVLISNIWILWIDHLVSDIEDALKRKCEVRLLVARPGGEVQSMRHDALNAPVSKRHFPVESYIAETIEFIRDIRSRAQSDADLGIRCFNFMPAGALYVVDDCAHFCPFWGTQKAVDGPAIVSRSGEFLHEVEKEFEKWWEVSEDAIPFLENERGSKHPS